MQRKYEDKQTRREPATEQSVRIVRLDNGGLVVVSMSRVGITQTNHESVDGALAQARAHLENPPC